MNFALARRKPDRPNTIRSVRSLAPEDLAVLRQRAAHVPLRQLRDTHHRLAWLLASGHTQTEAAQHGGFSIARISTLLRDPSFRELVDKYRAEVKAVRLEHTDNLAAMAVANMTRAERMISDILEDAEESGEPIPLKILDAIASSRMDRFGYGKHNTTTNVNFEFAAKLEAAISRAKASR